MLIVALAGLMAVIAAAVKLSSPGPAFFKQKRIGRWGVPFWVCKFRTMRVAPGGPLITSANDPRITRVGRWLRRWKLDELPQLYNVLCGDMSLVGPRPQVSKYVGLYSEEQKRVLSVRPGLTGYYQLSFPHYEAILAEQADPEQYYISVHLQEKLALELKHVEEPGLVKELRILGATVAAIWGCRSVRQAGNSLEHDGFWLRALKLSSYSHELLGEAGGSASHPVPFSAAGE
jgi:lipopolysaccharide/colanic/teichoic acid biosynthesis glycosyltransferase